LDTRDHVAHTQKIMHLASLGMSGLYIQSQDHSLDHSQDHLNFQNQNAHITQEQTETDEVFQPTQPTPKTFQPTITQTKKTSYTFFCPKCGQVFAHENSLMYHWMEKQSYFIQFILKTKSSKHNVCRFLSHFITHSCLSQTFCRSF